MSENNEQQFPIPVAVGIVYNMDGEVIVGKKLAHDALIFPGGKIEVNENPATALAREILEETGVIIRPDPILAAVRPVHTFQGHFLNLYYYARWESGEPRVLEPEKHRYWKWQYLTECGVMYNNCHDLLPGLNDLLIKRAAAFLPENNGFEECEHGIPSRYICPKCISDIEDEIASKRYCRNCNDVVLISKSMSGYSTFHRREMETDWWECPKCGHTEED
jgi:8-oxo-dGTP pyrophosphatase MutT (NUDIX family)